MTVVSNRPAVASRTREALPAGLIDQVAEAVVFAPDPHARSLVIADLAAEVFETIRWLHGPHPDPDELASLYRVLAEAYAHRSRMAARATARGRR
jgi:hypothetical protein